MAEPADGKKRCPWCLNHPLYIAYHDEEWGVPVHDDRKLFEALILDGAQAGLSWLTILKKREGYRQAFDQFDFTKVARYTQGHCDKLCQNQQIIRNPLKIRSAVSNAQAFIEVRKEHGSFDAYLWGFIGRVPIVNDRPSMQSVPAKTELSNTIAKDLKKRGFTFVGSTTIYAMMQAIGMVDDHLNDCWRKGCGVR